MDRLKSNQKAINKLSRQLRRDKISPVCRLDYLSRLFIRCLQNDFTYTYYVQRFETKLGLSTFWSVDVLLVSCVGRLTEVGQVEYVLVFDVLIIWSPVTTGDLDLT